LITNMDWIKGGRKPHLLVGPGSATVGEKLNRVPGPCLEKEKKQRRELVIKEMRKPQGNQSGQNILGTGGSRGGSKKFVDRKKKESGRGFSKLRV